jgi:hypothetical protein
MLREIITSAETNVTIHLPNDMVGKTVEVIAFEINNESTAITPSQRLSQIEALTKNTLVDISGFRFDRDEANNYG